MHLRDLSNMYHRLRVPAARVAAQSLGPRLPVEWFADLDDEHTDGLFSGERPWWYSDVRGPGAGPPPHGYVQPACVSLVMGCHRAVGVAQAVALRSVVGSGLLDVGTYLWEGWARLRTRPFAGRGLPSCGAPLLKAVAVSSALLGNEEVWS